MNRKFVIGPNARAINYAKRYSLIPPDAEHIGKPQGLRGLHNIILYIIKYGRGENYNGPWGSLTNNRRLEEFKHTIIPTANIDIKEVFLP